MILKQKLKQKINLALSTHRIPTDLVTDLSREWYRTQKDNRKGCVNANQRNTQMLKSIQSAGDYLSVSRSTVYRLIQEGKLQRVYLRGAPRITEKSLARLAGEIDG